MRNQTKLAIIGGRIDTLTWRAERLYDWLCKHPDDWYSRMLRRELLEEIAILEAFYEAVANSDDCLLAYDVAERKAKALEVRKELPWSRFHGWFQQRFSELKVAR